MWALLALGLTGYAVARLFAGYPAPSPRPVYLSRREIATLAAVSDVLFPPGGALAPSGAEAGVPAYVDRLARASHPRQRLLIRSLLLLVEHGTLLFPAPGGVSGLRRFSALSMQQRAAVIEGWQSSRYFGRRLVFTTLRALCTLGYLAYPPVLRALRLAPYAIDTPIVEADLLYPRIGDPSHAVRPGVADLSGAGPAEPVSLDGPLREGFAEEAP